MMDEEDELPCMAGHDCAAPITELWVVIAHDAQGDHLCMERAHGGLPAQPLMAGGGPRLEWLRQQAGEMAACAPPGTTIKLVRFSHRTTWDVMGVVVQLGGDLPS